MKRDVQAYLGVKQWLSLLERPMCLQLEVAADRKVTSKGELTVKFTGKTGNRKSEFWWNDEKLAK